MIAGVVAAPVLAALHAGCFPPGERWDEAAMEMLLRMPGCFGWLGALSDGTPCGLGLARVAADEAELLTLGVLVDHRGERHAERLLRAVCQEAAGRGAARMILEVASGNLAARSLYRRLGFEQVGMRRRYYPDGADALMLCVSLPLVTPPLATQMSGLAMPGGVTSE